MWNEVMTGDEARYMVWVLEQLKGVAWTAPLLTAIKAGGGICYKTKPLLFEARVALELHRQSIVPSYEFSAGVGDSSIDFFIPGTPEFLVEVVSLRMSEGAKGASTQSGPLSVFSMSSSNLHIEGRERQSIEAEVITAQRKIGEKVYAKGRETKFPDPAPNRYHVILVDARGLKHTHESIEDMSWDLKEIISGYMLRDGDYLIEMGISQSDGTSRSVVGLFDVCGRQHPEAYGALLRRKIHFIHFVNERKFEVGELVSKLAGRPCSNPYIFTEKQDVEAVIKAYPLFDYPP